MKVQISLTKEDIDQAKVEADIYPATPASHWVRDFIHKFDRSVRG